MAEKRFEVRGVAGLTFPEKEPPHDERRAPGSAQKPKRLSRLNSRRAPYYSASGGRGKSVAPPDAPQRRGYNRLAPAA